MTNEPNKGTAPSVFADLQQVSSTSAGSVSKPSWNPSVGATQRRQQQEQLNQQYQAQLPKNVLENRLLLMEGAIKDLQNRIKELEANG